MSKQTGSNPVLRKQAGAGTGGVLVQAFVQPVGIGLPQIGTEYVERTAVAVSGQGKARVVLARDNSLDVERGTASLEPDFGAQIHVAVLESLPEAPGRRDLADDCLGAALQREMHALVIDGFRKRDQLER